MAAQRQPAEGPRESRGPCGHCGSVCTEAHCRGWACTWIRCTNCRQLTDLRKARGNQG
ncbi:MAG: hypothetical protein JWM19_926 [Actinomycetia bacterium]|nr:hypothetical protein [Actinomycetes bacterium]